MRVRPRRRTISAVSVSSSDERCPNRASWRANHTNRATVTTAIDTAPINHTATKARTIEAQGNVDHHEGDAIVEALPVRPVAETPLGDSQASAFDV
jgi:hypothetical protein